MCSSDLKGKYRGTNYDGFLPNVKKIGDKASGQGGTYDQFLGQYTITVIPPRNLQPTDSGEYKPVGTAPTPK